MKALAILVLVSVLGAGCGATKSVYDSAKTPDGETISKFKYVKDRLGDEDIVRETTVPTYGAAAGGFGGTVVSTYPGLPTVRYETPFVTEGQIAATGIPGGVITIKPAAQPASSASPSTDEMTAVVRKVRQLDRRVKVIEENK